MFQDNAVFLGPFLSAQRKRQSNFLLYTTNSDLSGLTTLESTMGDNSYTP
jgi:hypothetical protein